jgi:hypothetical protein
LPEAIVFDTRHLTEGDRHVYAGNRRYILAPNLIGGWVPYCTNHDLGLLLPTRQEARKKAGRDTKNWCYGCIEEAKRPAEVDLERLAYSASQECGCSDAWKSLRIVQGPRYLSPRCESCGAVSGFLHFQTLDTGIDKGGERKRIVCSCGFFAHWEAELEHHVTEENRKLRFTHQGYGRWTRS